MRWEELFNPYIYYIVEIDKYNAIPKEKDYIPRTTKFHEIELITEGEGVMIINGEEVQIKKGDMMYRSPSTSIHAHGGYHCYLVIFEPFITKDNYINLKTIKDALGNYLTKLDVKEEEKLILPSKIKVDNIEDYKHRFKKMYIDIRKNGNTLKSKIIFLELICNL